MSLKPSFPCNIQFAFRKKKRSHFVLIFIELMMEKLMDMNLQVRDEEGRRRFHGAFTGGYSAGYYNTVGSKEGELWVELGFLDEIRW